MSARSLVRSNRKVPASAQRSRHLASRPSRLGLSGMVLTARKASGATGSPGKAFGPAGWPQVPWSAMLQLFDTAKGGVLPLEPRDPGKVSMYVCGPTVYGPPHLGHGRQTLVYDVLRRYLTWNGLDVVHISNITDVDDNIINRAARENVDWTEVATHWEKVWYEAMDTI